MNTKKIQVKALILFSSGALEWLVPRTQSAQGHFRHAGVLVDEYI